MGYGLAVRFDTWSWVDRRKLSCMGCQLVLIFVSDSQLYIDSSMHAGGSNYVYM